ncbi:MAG: efflux RND transporter periplasmic adaptor subunit [Gammaproteobacteria bacterium]|nr:efflux RND transporter periplasmic adaptor subunit [Gammaproteobacteria bacterium]MDE2346103.1 efflux RND transporter periplasmic adaptor subunit [Gammaproteobacteria bacterium]
MRKTIIILLALTLSLAACGRKPQSEEQVRPVQTLVMGKSGTTISASYAGVTTARFESKQGFRVSGTVIKRLVEVGQHVLNGQPLMQLDPSNLDLQLQAAQAQLNAARSQEAQAQVTLNRDAELLKQNFISQAEYDRDQVNLEAAKAQLQVAQSQFGEAGNQADYGTLRAAVTGVVTQIDADVGQVVSSGKPVITIAKDGDREVVINVPESRVEQLRKAQGLFVTLWAVPGKRYTAELREIDPDTDQTTRTYDAHVTVLKPDSAMLLGMTAYVHLPDIGGQKAYVLPLPAVFYQGDKPMVWLVNKDSLVTAQPVSLQTARGNDAIINGGLKDGDVVVTAGASLLHAGQKVKPVAPPNPWNY